MPGWLAGWPAARCRANVQRGRADRRRAPVRLPSPAPKRDVIRSGAQVLADAADALFSWQVHLRASVRVSPSSATAGSGTVVLLGLRAGPVQIGAPCRVVYVVNEPDRQGFAYGTLLGHPERGEEAFLIERHGGGAVTFTITAFSRPATLLATA